MSILGNRVLRVEDPRFLRGEGQYVENLPLDGALTVTFVRSLVAHARITSVDASGAEALPNVQVLTGADVDAGPMGPPPIPVLEQRMTRPLVAKDVVRFVGDIVAIVLSEDRASGADAAELVFVDYESLPVVVDPVEAAKDEVLLFPEVGTNVAGHAGSPEHDDALFDGCDVVVSQTLVSQRMAGCPLEVRSAAAEVDANGRVTAWLSTQVPHRDQGGIAATLGLDPAELRIIAPDVGGGFGAKSAFGAEEALIVWLARHLGKPVRWTESRSESMIALPHGRGQWLELTLGGTRDGSTARVPPGHPAGRRRVPGGRRLPAEPHRAPLERRLCDSPDRGRGSFRGHQHDSDDHDPRRRQARGLAGDRAHDRTVRGRDRDGSGRR